MGSCKFVEMKFLVSVTGGSVSGQCGQESCSASLAQKVGFYYTWREGGKREREACYPEKNVNGHVPDTSVLI